MRIAYIHDENKIQTGADHITELIVRKLREHNVFVKNVYPKTRLIDYSHNIQLKGVSNILFFYSLLEQKDEILKYDLIQGTTFTPITFLSFDIPVVTYFGSTTAGILQATPKTKELKKDLRDIMYKLKEDRVISEVDVKSNKPLRDISDIQDFAASKSTRVIVASKIVKNNLVKYGKIHPNKIAVIHNAIEDYWFEKPIAKLAKPKLIFLGRVGGDVFTWKTKGVDRLIRIYQLFPNQQKISLIMTTNKKIGSWLNKKIPKHKLFLNFPKKQIPNILKPERGGIFLLTSRYEGFSLSLIEAMSQGLIPVTFPVGVAPEIIVNGKNGYLVNSTQEARKRINEILRSEQLRTDLSFAAYKTALQFRADILAKKLVSLYEKITGKTVRRLPQRARVQLPKKPFIEDADHEITQIPH
ncbi:glycosyltransferase family 4 protein [Candidatus Roizmanbacteria bacterium]|nr:glycosyltransferase family 4 protein [Candidatus Roizmanbacteria bacterium]